MTQARLGVQPDAVAERVHPLQDSGVADAICGTFSGRPDDEPIVFMNMSCRFGPVVVVQSPKRTFRYGEA